MTLPLTKMTNTFPAFSSLINKLAASKKLIAIIVILGIALASVATVYITGNHVTLLHQVSVESMHPTFIKGDRVIVNRLAYRNQSPKTGDIIAYQQNLYNARLKRRMPYTFIGRVIASGGQTFRMADRKVYVDGAELQDDYAYYFSLNVKYFREPEPEKHGPIRVEPNTVYILDDNRDLPVDSRSWGCLPEEQIMGKVLCIYWSEYKDEVHYGRIGKPLFR